MTFQVSDHPAVHDARTQPPEQKYKEVNVSTSPGGPAMAFHLTTPNDLCALLVHLHRVHTRVVLVYGDVETGAIWESATPERGRIGRSSGTHKVPLLIRTSRSLGGEQLLDHCILQVRASAGGRVLWHRKKDGANIPLIKKENVR